MAKSVMEQLREYHLEQGLPLGMLADGPTPISWEESQQLYDKPFYSNWTGFDPTGSSGVDEGGGTLDALKTLGMGALNTLSVPQAVVFTLGSKAIEGVTGREGMDWSDMAGGFSDDYEGFKEILEQSGVDEDSGWAKWAGLAGDIVLDPLWAVAPLAKLAKTGGNAGRFVGELAKPARGNVPPAKPVATGINKDDWVAAIQSLRSTPTKDPQKLELAKALGATFTPGRKAGRFRAESDARAEGLAMFDDWVAPPKKLTDDELASVYGSPAAQANDLRNLGKLLPPPKVSNEALRASEDLAKSGLSADWAKAFRTMATKADRNKAASSKAVMQAVEEAARPFGKSMDDASVNWVRASEDNFPKPNRGPAKEKEAPLKPQAEIESVVNKAKDEIGPKDELGRSPGSLALARAITGVDNITDATGASRVVREATERVRNYQYQIAQKSREDYAYGIRLGWRPTRPIKIPDQATASKKIRTGEGKVEIQLSKSMVRRLDQVGKVGRLMRAVSLLPVEQIAKQAEAQGQESVYHVAMTLERNKEALRMEIRKDFPDLDEAGVEKRLEATSSAMTTLAGFRNSALTMDGVETAMEAQRALKESGALFDKAIAMLDDMQARYLVQLEILGKKDKRLVDMDPAKGGYMYRMLDDESKQALIEYNRKMARMEGRDPDAVNVSGKSGDLKERSMGSFYNYFSTAQFREHLSQLMDPKDVEAIMGRVQKDIAHVTSKSEWLKQAAQKARPVRASDDLPDEVPISDAEALRYFGFNDQAELLGDTGDALNEMAEEFVLNPDFFATALQKEKLYQGRMTERLIEQIYVDAGVLERVNVNGKSVLRNVNKDPDSFDFKFKSYDKLKKIRDKTPEDYAGFGGTALRLGRGLKLFFTQPWPGHYWNNMLGDFFNSMVSLGFYQAAKNTIQSGLMRKYDPMSQIAMQGRRVGNADLDAFYYTKVENGKTVIDTSKGRDGQKLYTVAGREYTGDELLALAHMAGIGRGFTGEIGMDFAAEIGAASTIFDAASWKGTGAARKYYRMMARNNVNREDAMRFRTWISHMERNGGDPMQAAMSTIDGVFDYGRLTNFEKIWMRNIIMFYTWMRLNTPYQVRSMVKNPALYSAYGDIERAREKSPFEPGYVAEMGLIPIPGFGNISIGAPWADLNKIPVPGLPNADEGFGEKIASDYLSSVNPIFKVPLELMVNKDVFTGTPIEKYPGHLSQPKTPFIGHIFNSFGVGQMARMQKDGEMVPAIPAKTSYVIDSITGPLGVFNRFDKADDDTYGGYTDWITHIAGIGKRVKEKESWARAAEQMEAREKANETRRRNATAVNPNYTGG